MTSEDVVIERVYDAQGPAFGQPRTAGDAAEELWRVVSASAKHEDCVVSGKPDAIDLALSRLANSNGRLYIRETPEAEPLLFNPAGG